MSTIAELELFTLTSDYHLRWTDHASDKALTTTIIRVTDSDGVVGMAGYDSYLPRSPDFSVLEMVMSLSDAVLGRDVNCRESLLHELCVGVVFPLSPAALSLLDVALWDLTARRSDLPVFKMLGGMRNSMPAYASLETMTTPEDYLDAVADAQADGLRIVKVHAWGDPVRDIDLVQLLHDTYPDLTLMLDAEGVYDARGALFAARHLEAMGCRWFEAPLPDHDLSGYRDLRHRVEVPILAAGYAMWDPQEFAEALRDPPWSALRSEIGSTLGITYLCKLATLAEAFNMNLEPVSYGHSLHQIASLHVMLAFPNVSYFELPYPMKPWEAGVLNPVRPDASGFVSAPLEVGLGISMDWEFVESKAQRTVRLTA
jgi:L-alanine-DL-glutamate epimerase-like enolase superfamily enzyme